MPGELTFVGWQRPGVYRLPGSSPRKKWITLGLAVESVGLGQSKSPDGLLDFEIFNPSEVAGFRPGAVTRTSPAPFANGVETTKCVYAEFAAPDLPWRYSASAPEAGAPGPPEESVSALRPWIALVVGTPGELIRESATSVKLTPELCAEYDLSQSGRWAHVQIEEGVIVSRIVSTRALLINQDYNAAIVPVGESESWPIIDGHATMPLFHFWQFQTGEEGDFRSLAARLKPATPDPSIGRSTVIYSRLPGFPTFTVKGALVTVSPDGPPDSEPDPQEIRHDLAALMTPATDGEGRPIIGLPRYGDEWLSAPETAAWGAEINQDPRHRAIAGLGLRAGVELQEMISSAATEQAGALEIAAQRIRYCAFGLLADASLWKRRLPTEPAHRLLIFGPSLRRMVTDRGPVLNLMAGGERPLPPGIFSSAARRLLRRVGRVAAPNATDPSVLLEKANTCPPLPASNHPGLPHADSAPGAVDPAAQTEPTLCHTFRKLPLREVANPVEWEAKPGQKVKFTENDERGAQPARCRINTWETDPDQLTDEKMALLFEKVLDITLPVVASRIEVTVMHRRSSPLIEAFNEDGTLAGRVGTLSPMLEPGTLEIRGRAINRVLITAPGDETYLHDFCFDPVDALAILSGGDLISRLADGNAPSHRALMDRFERSAVPARLPANGRSLAGKLRELIGEGRGLPTLALLELLDHLDAGRIKQAEELAAQIINGAAEPDGEFLMRFWAGLSAPPPSRPCRGIDLKAVSDALSGQIDPAHQHSFVRNRVLSGINGLGTDGLLPPEVCLGLDLPAWRFLRDHAPDWLLPGAERIAPDSVIGLESNSEFIEAFLLGINKQALSEFRWRNIPIKSKCTPIKMFWGQVGRGGITRERDITGVEVWPNESRLGHNAHRPEGSPNGNFVLLIRGDLFRRYPETSVYLVSGGQPGGPPDPSTVAGADREFPNFQGGIGADITFFRFDITADDAKSYWVVIEETPRGYSFVNDRVLEPARSDPRAGAYAIAKDGKDFAIAAFADPVRVLIRAEDILP